MSRRPNNFYSLLPLLHFLFSTTIIINFNSPYIDNGFPHNTSMRFDGLSLVWPMNYRGTRHYNPTVNLTKIRPTESKKLIGKWRNLKRLEYRPEFLLICPKTETGDIPERSTVSSRVHPHPRYLSSSVRGVSVGSLLFYWRFFTLEMFSILKLFKFSFSVSSSTTPLFCSFNIFAWPLVYVSWVCVSR